MNFKETLHFLYGFFMGTSVQYVKKAKRHLWPLQYGPVSGVQLAVGGSHNCAVLAHEQELLLIDTGSGVAAEEWRDWLKRTYPEHRVRWIVNTHMHRDAAGGNDLYPEAERIYGPRSAQTGVGAKFEAVDSIKQIPFGNEVVHLHFVPSAASAGDLVVHLEKANLVFLGELFFNHIHPILRGNENLNVELWIQALKNFMDRFQPLFWIPAEGVPGTNQDLQDFISYLVDLRNGGIEFSECRQRYDWTEIPAYTSLEENFDLIRSNKKTHVTVNLPDMPFS